MKASFVRLFIFVFGLASFGICEISLALMNPQINPLVQPLAQFQRPPLQIPPETEIQIFVDYQERRKRQQPDLKVVSSALAPRSLAYIYFEHHETPTNAACFWGSPGDARILLEEMTALFNLEGKRRVRIHATPFYDEETKNMALHVFTKDEWNQVTELFPRMRKCKRPSTPDERLN